MIWDPDPAFFPIPDPGVKKAPDPGSATLPSDRNHKKHDPEHRKYKNLNKLPPSDSVSSSVVSTLKSALGFRDPWPLLG
jgi:hypothetical protein